jgi:hypothetical protein
MMAVDSKQGTNGTNGTNGTTAPSSPPVTAAGTGSNPVARPSDAALPKRKRSSSLMKNASSLPTVEHSLEEFIAKANQTLVDVSSWEEAKEQDAQRKEQDANRWKQAEVQMRESEAREQSLRRQLDGLQGKLAEAEARAAVAGTQLGSAAHDTTLNELRAQIEKAMQRMRAAEERSQELSSEVNRLQAEGSARTPLPVAPHSALDEDEAAERVRLAEAKAAKAIAAARAAQAGLTVSSADIAAIESGLVVVAEPKRSSPVLPIAFAFIGGLAIMFVVWKFVLNKEVAATPAASTAAPAAPVVVQPAQPPAPPPAQPTVTPIDDKAAPAAVPADEKKPAPSVTPIEEPKPEDVKTEPAKTEETPKAAAQTKEEPVVETQKATPKKATRKATPKAAPKAKSTIADPFAETPAPKKETKKPAEKKPSGGIVDPF